MSIQRWTMDPRSGKYAEPMGVELAVTVLSEMVDEWSWDDDPHGYCHTRRPIIALLNAYEDHVAALADVYTLMGGAIESAIAQERVDVIRECIAVVEALPHEDACCSRGCACQTWGKQERCDLSCNCSFWTLPGTAAALRALLPEEES